MGRISIAGFDLGEVRGAPASTAKFELFYQAMVKRGYSTKPILLGQSRGGIMTLAWAFRNPDKVIPDKDHQVDPTFFECPELVEFVLKHGK